MNIQTMHDRLDLRVQKVNSNAYDNFLPTEKDAYLNDAISQFVKDRVEPRSNKHGIGFEQSIKRIEDVRTLIKSSELDTEEVTNIFGDGVFVDKITLPSDFFLAISVNFKIQYNEEGVTYTTPSTKRVVDGAEGTDYQVKRVRGEIVQHDDLQKFFDDPFNKPRINVPIYTVDNDAIYAYTNDKFIVDKIALTYIRQPAEVSLSVPTDCDLSENVHSEIVAMAAEDMLSDIEALGKQAQLENLNDFE